MSFIDECLDTLGDCLDAAKDAVVDVVMDEDNQKIAAGVLGGRLASDWHCCVYYV